MTIQNLYPNIDPTLLLDFANVKALDPRITFTRASTATYYGTDTAKAEENLLIRSQDFAFGASSQTGWNKTRATVGSAVTAPNGTTTAEPLTQASGQTISGFVLQSVSVTANDYVASVFAKPNGKNFLRFAEDVGTGTARISFIDLSTGTAGTTNAGHTITIVATTEGFFRVSVVFAVNATRSGGVFFSLADTDNSTVVVDSGGIILWGAQLEQRSAVTAYTPTTDQPITNFVPVLESAAAGEARFDHNPVTGESLGLLIEESRTNLILRSEEFDNAAWTKTNATVTANTIVAPDGTLTGDLITCTATGNFNGRVSQSPVELTAGINASLSFYAKRSNNDWVTASVSITNAKARRCWWNLATGTIGGTTTANAGGGTLVSHTITPVGNDWYRLVMVVNPNADQISGTQLIQNSDDDVAVNATEGQSVFLWGASLEQGAFPTSYVKTTTAQVTRAADAASMTGANFSSWYRADEGTVYVDAKKTSSEFNVLLYSANDNSALNRHAFIYTTTTQLRFRSITNNVGNVAISITVPSGDFIKSAGAYKVNDFAFSLNGGAVGTDTSALVPVVDKLNIGSEFNGGNALNGHIRKLAYYPKRIANDQLQALTG